MCVCIFTTTAKKLLKWFKFNTPKIQKQTRLKTTLVERKNSYSFVLPPMSIQKQECEFLYKVPAPKIDEFAFNEIRFSYFDEKNRIMECVFCKADRGWDGIDFNYENEYFELKCSKKRGK